MNLDELKRLFDQCTIGAAKSTKCRDCSREARFMVPGDGLFCAECLPAHVELMDFDEYLKRERDEQ